MDIVAYALAKKYIDKILENAGSLQGANCTIKSVTETDDGNTVVFEWINGDGTTETSTMFVKNGVDGKDGNKGDKGDSGNDGSNGKDGKSITAISLTADENGAIIGGTATLSDDSTIAINITTATA